MQVSSVPFEDFICYCVSGKFGVRSYDLLSQRHAPGVQDMFKEDRIHAEVHCLS